MARNGSGTFSLLATLAPANTTSNSSTVNSIMDDIATGLTDSINVDGTKAFEANQPMGGFKLTGMGTGSAATDSVTLGQVQAGRANWSDGGGTADAITASYTPAVTSVTDGDLFYVRATAANATTTPTFTPNSGTVTARTIVKNGNVALAAGDIAGDGHELHLRYRSSDTKYELLNPKGSSYTVNGLTEQTSVDTADMLGGYDTSGTAERKFSVNNVFKAVNSFTEETAVAVDDVLPLYDTSATTADKATVKNVLKSINGLTEDTSPDASADFVLTYDNSASDVKKVKPANLGGGVTDLGNISTASGSSASLGSLTLTSYKFVRLVFEAVQLGTGTTILLGTSTSDDVAVTQATGGASQQIFGYIDIDLSTGRAFSWMMRGTTTWIGSYGTTTITTAATTISVAPGSYVFEAGNISVYGFK